MDTIPTHPICIVVSRVNFDLLRHASNFDTIVGDLGMIILKKNYKIIKKNLLLFIFLFLTLDCLTAIYTLLLYISS